MNKDTHLSRPRPGRLPDLHCSRFFHFLHIVLIHFLILVFLLIMLVLAVESEKKRNFCEYTEQYSPASQTGAGLSPTLLSNGIKKGTFSLCRSLWQPRRCTFISTVFGES